MKPSQNEYRSDQTTKHTNDAMTSIIATNRPANYWYTCECVSAVIRSSNYVLVRSLTQSVGINFAVLLLPRACYYYYYYTVLFWLSVGHRLCC